MTKAQKEAIFAAFQMIRDDVGRGASVPVSIIVTADNPDVIHWTAHISPTAITSGTISKNSFLYG